jgi:glycosyltransferase involved in cell wall biosynthesis
MRLASVTRVLPTPDDPSQGIFVQNRLNAMRRIVPMTIVQPIPYFPALKPLPSWINERDDGHRRVPMFYVPRFFKSVDGVWLARAVEPVLEALHRANPLDAIDAHFGYPDAVGCAGIARRLDVPLFMTLRGVENEQLATRLIGRQLRDAMTDAAGCICVSHFLADLAIRHGVPEDKVTVIHNAVDRGLFRPCPATRTRADLGLPEDRPIVISVGHVVPRKRHHVLIEAMADPSLRAHDAMLLIVGSNKQDVAYAERLSALVRSSGLEGSVRFIGNRPPAEVGDYLRLADLFALLSAREGCCNSVLEALACGTRVVATDVGDNRYFVNESNGRLVPVDHSAAAASAIDEVLRATSARAAIAETLSVGDWDGVARRVVDYMTRVLDG